MISFSNSILKITFCSLFIVSSSWAITLDGRSTGTPQTSKTLKTLPQESLLTRNTSPILENPTSDQINKAFRKKTKKKGTDKPIKMRDIASLKVIGFGIFIDFKIDSDEVIPNEVLQAILEVLLDLELEASIQITGHTDNQGGRAYSNALSLRRAASVRQWLEDHGVRKGAIKIKGVGYQEPVATNATEEGRRKNRRVEFTRIYKN